MAIIGLGYSSSFISWRWCSSRNFHDYLMPGLAFNRIERQPCLGTPQHLLASSFRSNESVERNDAANSGPLVGPNPSLTPEDAVICQLDALSRNDDPRKDHGLEVMYNFANAEGTLEGGSLSSYFGFPSDLYHFGHFCMKFKSRFPLLLNFKKFYIVDVIDDYTNQSSGVKIQVKIVQNDESSTMWTFIMSKVARGSQKPCWMTDAILLECK